MERGTGVRRAFAAAPVLAPPPAAPRPGPPATPVSPGSRSGEDGARSRPAWRRRRVTAIVRSRWFQWMVLAAPVAGFAERAWSHRWMTDDGFINLRVVAQITSGHGPVFNAGQRVEAFTSPLWIAVLTVADVLTPVRLEWLAVGLGLAGSCAGLALATAGAANLVRARGDRASLLVPFGALVVIAIYAVWAFETSGLETGLVFAWLGGCLFVLARWASRGPDLRAGTAVLLGLGWLIRPELVLVSACLLAAVLAASGGWSWWRRIGIVAAAVGLPALYELFRIGYYASLVPNTALAKEADRARWDLGRRYLTSFLGTYHLEIPLAVLAVVAVATFARRRVHDDAARRSRLVVGAFLLAALLETAYIVRVGGDYMHARLLLPALFTACAPLTVIPWRRWHVAAFAIVLAWAVVAAVAFRPSQRFGVFATDRQHAVTVDDFGLAPGDGLRAAYDRPGIYYGDRRIAPPPAGDPHSRVVASWGVGVVGYALGPDVEIVDLLGLGDELTSHFELQRRGYPGHEKPLPAPWFVARYAPGVRSGQVGDLTPPMFSSLIASTHGRAFDREVSQARAVLHCGDVARLVDAARRPLDLGSVLDNVGVALDTYRMRIPPEPSAAYARFCRASHSSH